VTPLSVQLGRQPLGYLPMVSQSVPLRLGLSEAFLQVAAPSKKPLAEVYKLLPNVVKALEL
jgi:hypothetical protein